MQNQGIESLISKLPKADLHLHLDGSIRINTIIEIAKEQKIPLPSYTSDGLGEVLFKDNYANLEEYLKTFGYSCSVMQTPENLERIAYELAIDCQKEGVRYIEVRFDPFLVTNSTQSSEEVIKRVNKGLDKAKQEYNQQISIKEGKEPPFHYVIIICALRFLGPWSDYYVKLFNSLSHLTNKKVTQIASLEQIHSAIKSRDDGIPIVAFDLAGAEAGNPCSDFIESYKIAHTNFLHKIVHAGESSNAESILDAVQLLYAERIGHGFSLFETENYPSNKKDAIERLIEYIQNKQITIEVCLTSNLQTIPKIKTVAKHSYIKMLDADLSLAICTDNRTVSKTSVTQELTLARKGYNFSSDQFKKLVLNPFDKSFFPAKNKEKQQFIRQCSIYYNQICKGTDLE